MSPRPDKTVHLFVLFPLLTCVCFGEILPSSLESGRGYSDVPFCSFCNDDEYCQSSGQCCKIQKENLKNTFLETHRLECVQAKLLSDKAETDYLDHYDAFFINRVWMISKCPISADQMTKDLCENSSMKDEFGSVIPVTDSIFHYRNKHCALCNGAPVSFKLKPWAVEIHCNTNISGNENGLLKTVKRRKCNLFYRPPVDEPVQECFKNVAFVSNTSCLKTFQKSRYSPTEPPCGTGIDLTSIFSNKVYVCFHCNTTEQLQQSDRSCPLFHHGLTSDISPPFTAILDLNVIEKKKEVNYLECDSSTQLYDEKFHICREIWCHKYRYLVNGNCAVGKDVSQDIYEMFVIFIELTAISSSGGERFTLRKMDQSYFQDKVNYIFGKFFPKGAISDFRIYMNSSNDVIHNLIVRIVTNVILLENSTSLLDTLVAGLHKRNISLLRTVQFHAKFISFSNYSTASADTFEVTVRENITEVLETITVIGNTSFEFDNNTELISITKLHICPFIELRKKELFMSVKNDILYLRGQSSDVEFTKWEFEQVHDTIKLCVDDYKSIYKSSASQSGVSVNSINTKQLLAFFCVCLSILCLLITIITYILFRQLQSQPGINNLILSTFLVLAQTMYQFGSGQRSLSDTACALIGGTCHFLWLSVMFSMNACSIEMFTVFKNLRQLSQIFKWKTTFKSILYIVFGSLALVAINLAVSLYLSNGKHSGYGGSPCYLSSYLMHLITFLIPSAILITTNLFLFIYVIIRIKTLSLKSASLNKERNYLGIYARLSTLTGLTWLIGFLQIILDNEALQYIFIVLNASQGVFIMVAFILNRNIYDLCTKMRFFGRSKDTYITSMKQVSNINSRFNADVSNEEGDHPIS